MVDPNDWSHPTLSWAILPELLVHSIHRCSPSSTENRPCNFSMRGNYLAYASTQGTYDINNGSMENMVAIYQQSRPPRHSLLATASSPQPPRHSPSPRLLATASKRHYGQACEEMHELELYLPIHPLINL